MPYYGPDEDAYTILLEQTFLGRNFVGSVGYGVQLVLYILCARYLWQERKRRGRVMQFLLAYVTLLHGLSSLLVAVGIWTTEDIYINNRDYPGGPWTYFLATQDLPENVIFIVVLFTLTFLGDLLMLWRCWVIWASVSRLSIRLVVALPTLILLSSFALGTIWCLQSSQPGSSLYSQVPIAFGSSYYITSLGANIVITLLITARLFMHRQAILESLPPDHAKHYLSLVTIFIESAALHSVFALGFIITYAINNPMNQVFLTVSSTCHQVAGYLIILRVAQGRAWSTKTMAMATGATSQLSTIRFGPPTIATSNSQGLSARLSV